MYMWGGGHMLIHDLKVQILMLFSGAKFLWASHLRKVFYWNELQKGRQVNVKNKRMLNKKYQI